jgi:hypothetical protein
VDQARGSRGLRHGDPGRGGDGRGSRRRAIPRVWPPALWRSLGHCDTVPRRPRHAPAVAAAGLCAGLAPLQTNVPRSFRRSVTHCPIGSGPLQFVLRSHTRSRAGRSGRNSTPPSRCCGKPSNQRAGETFLQPNPHF